MKHSAIYHVVTSRKHIKLVSCDVKNRDIKGPCYTFHCFVQTCHKITLVSPNYTPSLTCTTAVQPLQVLITIDIELDLLTNAPQQVDNKMVPEQPPFSFPTSVWQNLSRWLGFSPPNRPEWEHGVPLPRLFALQSFHLWKYTEKISLRTVCQDLFALASKDLASQACKTKQKTGARMTDVEMMMSSLGT